MPRLMECTHPEVNSTEANGQSRIHEQILSIGTSHAQDNSQSQIDALSRHHSQSPGQSSSFANPSPENASVNLSDPPVTPLVESQTGCPSEPSPEHVQQSGNPSPAPQPSSGTQLNTLTDTDGDVVMTDFEIQNNQVAIGAKNTIDNVQESRSRSPPLELIMANLEVQTNQLPLRQSSRLEQKGPQQFPPLTPHRKPKPRNRVKADVPRHEAMTTLPSQDGSDPEHAIDVDSFFVGRQFFESMLTTELYQADNDISLNVEEIAVV